MKENLGKPCEDRITGFKGIITGYVNYLTGCDQYLIIPKAKKGGSYPDGVWLDTNRIDVETDAKPVGLNDDKPKGPDAPPPIL